MNVQKFAGVIRKALNFTDGNGSIVTVGITPSRPETGYGYICAERNAPEEIVKVREFKEKPTLDVAHEYLAAGNYFWNAGIFVWNVRTIIAELRAHAPQIAGVMDRIAEAFGTAEETEVLDSLFPTCDKISIDYAVMEKSENIHVIPCDIGWSDLGSYSSIKENIPSSMDDPVPDGGSENAERRGNKVIGSDIRTFDTEGCMIHAGDSRTVIVKGLKDYIVAVKNGNVLVCPLADEQMIKEYSAKK